MVRSGQSVYCAHSEQAVVAQVLALLSRTGKERGEERGRGDLLVCGILITRLRKP